MSTVDLQDGSGPIDVEPGGATVTFTLNTVKITYGSRGWQTASYTVDEDAISFDHVVKNSELAGTGTAQADIVTLAAVLSLVQPEGPLPLSLAAGRLSVDVESNRSVLTAMPTTSLPVDGSTIGPLHRYTVVFTYIGEVPEPR
ncbi:hypothetical protein D1871_18540 [Nakamurella silvestris]|nr:hypothetical protein D1871_18540 [Nakamurella silvestris]